MTYLLRHSKTWSMQQNLTEGNRPYQNVEYVSSRTGSKSHDQVLMQSATFGYGCSMLAAHFVPVCHNFSCSHGELVFMVAVSSWFIMVLPGVLQFTCSSATVRHSARGGRRSMKRQPRQRRFIQVCMRPCVCSVTPLLPYMYDVLMDFYLLAWYMYIEIKIRNHLLSLKFIHVFSD